VASDVSPRISVVTPNSLLAVYPVLKENTLFIWLVTALRTSTARGILAEIVHWLACMTYDLGWSLSLQTNCTHEFLQPVQINDEKSRR
jgi:hypothetical protein